LTMPAKQPVTDLNIHEPLLGILKGVMLVYKWFGNFYLAWLATRSVWEAKRTFSPTATPGW